MEGGGPCLQFVVEGSVVDGGEKIVREGKDSEAAAPTAERGAIGAPIQRNWRRVGGQGSPVYTWSKCFKSLGEQKTTELTKHFSLFEIVIFANKTLKIVHFLCQSSSHYVIKSSTKNDPNLQKKCRRIYQSFRSHFDVWKFLGFEGKMSNWMTDKLNCNVQSCFHWYLLTNSWNFESSNIFMRSVF